MRFFGGPLDGREQALGEVGPRDGHVVTHVHLHDGPKIETRYRLGQNAAGEWEYQLLNSY